jgi:MOSC domain-containing protein YiiM
MIGKILAIYLTPVGGEPLQPVDVAVLEPGRGLVGDRYYQSRGTFSETLKVKGGWEITLIEEEEIQRFNELEGLVLAQGEFRRNIITRDIRLNDLVGGRFRAGDALLEGIRLCEPCSHLVKFVGPQVIKGMAHRAGLRARILAGASVRPGDEIKVGE